MYYRYEKNVEITNKEIEKVEEGKELKLALDKYIGISSEYYPTLNVRFEGECLISVFTIDYENDNERKILALDTFLNIKDVLKKMFPMDAVDHACELLETDPGFDIQIAVSRKEKTDNLQHSLKEALNFFVLLGGVFKGDVRYERYVDEKSPMIDENLYDNVVRICE